MIMKLQYKSIFLTTMILLLMFTSVYSTDFRLYPLHVKNGVMYPGDDLKVQFSPDFEAGMMTDYIAVIEKKGRRIKLDQKYSRQDKEIRLNPEKPLVPGEKINIIVKKMSKSGNYFHLEEVMNKKVQVVQRSASAVKSDVSIEDVPDYERIPPAAGKEMDDDTVLEKMQMILSDDENTASPAEEKKKLTPEKRSDSAWYGDMLMINVWGHKDLSMKLRVDSKGMINYPFIGDLRVLGETASEIAKKIRSRLEDGYLRRAYVHVEFSEREKRRILIKVLGSVSNTGILEFKYKPSIIDVMATVGTPTVKGRKSWDNVKVKIIQNETEYEMDATYFLDSIEESNKLLLESGSTVYFKTDLLERKIYVLGNVTSPGKYDYYENMTVLDALVDAQGTKGQQYAYASVQDHFRANLRRVMVIRKNQEKKEVNVMVVNMQAVMFKGKMEYNIKVEPGDWIIVPQRRVRNLYTYISRLSPVLRFITDLDEVVNIFE